jgi:hypothetical protein
MSFINSDDIVAKSIEDMVSDVFKKKKDINEQLDKIQTLDPTHKSLLEHIINDTCESISKLCRGVAIDS